MRMQI